MKKILVLVAAAMAFTISCSKAEKEAPAGVLNEEQALVRLQMDFPRTYASQTATPAESDVKSLHVFFFDAVSGLLTDYDALTSDDFIWDSNTCTLRTEIQTNPGVKKIGIGINLPASIVTEITQAQNIKAVTSSTVYDVTSSLLAADSHFVMFSTEMPETTIYAEQPNSLTANVERLVGKAILVEAPDFACSPEISALGSFGPIYYKLMQTNRKSYLMKDPAGRDPNYLASDFIPNGPLSGNQYDRSVFENSTEYRKINAPGADYSTYPAFYGAENTSDFYQKGTTTYYMVKSQFTPSKFTGGDGATIHPNYTPDSDFWTVADGSITHICISATDAMTLAANAAVFPAGADVVRHEGGYCYWAVFIGAFVRNTFNICTLTEIKSFGAGNETSVIPDPEDPTDGSTTPIEVNLNVLDWAFDSSDEVDLE